MITAEDHILMERFVEGTLSGAELKEFQERMTADGGFHKEVDFYNLLLAGINRSREQELTNYITENVSVKQYTPRSVIAIVIVMLIIIGSGVGVWNYLEKDASRGNKNFFTNNIFTKKPASAGNEKPKQERRSASKQVNAKEADNHEEEAAAQPPPVDSTTVAQTAVADTSADDKIVIKKDELVSTAELPVIDKSNHSKAEEEKGKESLAKEAAEKLNPGAQLPEEENNHAGTLQVEFWQSPVNYKGFKLMKNKLVLFGIDRPDAVKLYSLNDQLYMQYGQMVSKLNPTYDYQSFVMLRESEIPSQLR